MKKSRKPNRNKGKPSPLAGRGPGLAFLKAHIAHEGDECVLWPWSRTHQGYGMVGYFGKLRRAHQLMCFFVHGERPTPKHHAAHSCGNGHLGCVNPRHLSWKTARENCLDTVAHGRHGSRHHKKHLTAEQVNDIRSAEGSQMAVAAKYGVSYWTVGRIRRNEIWKIA